MDMTTTQESQNGQQLGLFQPNSNQTLSMLEGSYVRLTTGSSPVTGMNRPDKYVTLQCQTCQKEFLRQRKEHLRAIHRYGGLRGTVRTFCSVECSRFIKNQRVCACGNKKAPHAVACKQCYLKDKHVQLTCTTCKKEFQRNTCEHQRHIQRHGNTGRAFCSKDCYEIHRATALRQSLPVTGKCPTCGNGIQNNRKFCSMACYAKRAAKKTEYTGNWSMQKHRVKKRDNGVCALCGQSKQRVAVHHIDHNATNNSLTNLVTLCEPCHGRYHRQTVEPVQKIIQAYFVEKVSGS